MIHERPPILDPRHTPTGADFNHLARLLRQVIDEANDREVGDDDLRARLDLVEQVAQSVQRIRGDGAVRVIQTPHGTSIYAPPPRDVCWRLHGKVASVLTSGGASWTSLFSNKTFPITVTVNPCDDAAATNTDTGTTLYLKLNELPHAAAGRICAVDDIVTYVPADQREAVPGVADTYYDGYVVSAGGGDGDADGDGGARLAVRPYLQISVLDPTDNFTLPANARLPLLAAVVGDGGDGGAGAVGFNGINGDGCFGGSGGGGASGHVVWALLDLDPGHQVSCATSTIGGVAAVELKNKDANTPTFSVKAGKGDDGDVATQGMGGQGGRNNGVNGASVSGTPVIYSELRPGGDGRDGDGSVSRRSTVPGMYGLGGITGLPFRGSFNLGKGGDGNWGVAFGVTPIGGDTGTAGGVFLFY